MLRLYAIVLLASCSHIAHVSAADSASGDSCTAISIPIVNRIDGCLKKLGASCDASQDLIDAVSPLVRCVYEALKDFNKPQDAVVAYVDVFTELINATNTNKTQALSIDLINSVNKVKAGTVRLNYCSRGNVDVSLPSALIGQCNTDLGNSCKKSATNLAAPLVSLVQCLVGNALPSAPEDKIIALVCDLVDSTNINAFRRLILWTGVYDIKRTWCQ
nr:uncharacterized protein LOC119163865 [Rhipicephalus microplus]